MIVTRADLERQIARVGAEIGDPSQGLFGPGSVSWKVDREAALFFGGGKAALLQLAHPFVAHAIDQHSRTRSDPLGRFQRTFESVHAMVFGDWDTVLRHARRVHAIHGRVTGEIGEDVGAFARGARYHANDQGALVWVWATLIDGALETHELVLGTLSAADREQYYQESKRFARLFGISDDALPANLAAFRDYVRSMLESDVIRVGAPAREIAGFLFQSRRVGFRPLFRSLEALTAGLLPAHLREQFGLPWRPADRAVFHATVAALRRTYPHWPRRLRYVPAYVRAHRRLRGLEGPDRIGDFVERLTTAPLAR
ncbi:MAG: DUF2236 domain-containing protein [Myxococcales bacterium]|nr:DUF2236 domain-containing protein [Myxococcales bacterium]